MAEPHELPTYPHADLSPELRKLLAAVSINGTVIGALASNTSITNHTKSGTLEIFLESARHAGIRNLFIAAFDQATQDWLAARDVPSLLRPTPPACQDAHSWVACAKADLARDAVTLGYNFMLVDTDLLFFRDPMEQGFDGSFDVESGSDGMADSGGGRKCQQTYTMSVTCCSLPLRPCT